MLWSVSIEISEKVVGLESDFSSIFVGCGVCDLKCVAAWMYAKNGIGKRKGSEIKQSGFLRISFVFV